MRQFIEAAAKHLPPSASRLRLIDLDGVAGDILLTLRDDLHLTRMDTNSTAWRLPSGSMDAVIGVDTALERPLLESILAVMRPGGRMILIHREGEPDGQFVSVLEAAGFTRILVEAAVENQGVLIRGEKPHRTVDTAARIQQTASLDDDLIEQAAYTGRYLFLLIRQLPNKPVWKLAPEEQIEWRAAVLRQDGAYRLLAFSSLPKAVSWMQTAVMRGWIRDVNKVAKFRKEAAFDPGLTLLLNPAHEIFDAALLDFIQIDPALAEAPDE